MGVTLEVLLLVHVQVSGGRLQSAPQGFLGCLLVLWPPLLNQWVTTTPARDYQGLLPLQNTPSTVE